MCLNNTFILNKKYIGNKKNGGNPPTLKDERLKYVPVGCGKCVECRKQKANEWKIRLFEEVSNDPNKWTFVTLTFSEKSRNSIYKTLRDTWLEVDQGVVNTKNGEFVKTDEPYKYWDDNAIATYAVRRFLERWRKETKKSVKHWLITEKGHQGTKRIHLHGLIRSKNHEFIKKKWSYGFIFCGSYVNEKTISYISKYVTKVDTVNRGFEGKILCSKGIGRAYIDSFNFRRHKFKGDETIEYYTTFNGYKLSLPVYYRNYAFTEEEREKLWQIRLDKNERFVMGERVDVSTNEGLMEYINLSDFYRYMNKSIGYYNNKNEQRANYINTLNIFND